MASAFAPFALLRAGTGQMLRSISQSSIAKAASLLFELELGDEDGVSTHVGSATKRLTALLEPFSLEAEQLQMDANQAAVNAAAQGPQGVDVRAFAKVLGKRGYTVWLRRGGDSKGSDQGSGRSNSEDSSPRSPTASHTMVVVALAGDDGSQDLVVVDPCFREQWTLSQPSKEYAALCGALPEVFVGRAEEVVAVVELMCDQMAKEFAADNRASPPWRQRDYMLTKWLPQRAHDERVDAQAAHAAR